MLTIKMTEDDYAEATSSLDDPGVCLFCGARVSGIEPDAKQYHCDECDTNNVYGLEEALIMGRIEFI